MGKRREREKIIRNAIGVNFSMMSAEVCTSVNLLCLPR